MVKIPYNIGHMPEKYTGGKSSAVTSEKAPRSKQARAIQIFPKRQEKPKMRDSEEQELLEKLVRERILGYMRKYKLQDINTKHLTKLGLKDVVRKKYSDNYRGLRRDLYLPTKTHLWKNYSEKERIDVIEDMARDLIANGIHLSASVLQGSYRSLYRAIQKYYTDGLVGLREKFQVTDTVKSGHKWKNTNEFPTMILALARKILEQKGDISTSDFSPTHRTHIYEYYPGGYQKLRRDLGLKVEGYRFKKTT